MTPALYDLDNQAWQQLSINSDRLLCPCNRSMTLPTPCSTTGVMCSKRGAWLVLSHKERWIRVSFDQSTFFHAFAISANWLVEKRTSFLSIIGLLAPLNIVLRANLSTALSLTCLVLNSVHTDKRKGQVGISKYF